MTKCNRCGTAAAQWRVEYLHDRKRLCTLCKEAFEMELSDSLGQSWMDENVTFAEINQPSEILPNVRSTKESE